MLKRFGSLFALVLALAVATPMLTACPGTMQQDTTSLVYKESIAVRSVTASRQTNDALLAAGKITVAQYDSTVAKLDAIIAGIRAARAANQPAAIDKGKADADAINVTLGGKAP